MLICSSAALVQLLANVFLLQTEDGVDKIHANDRNIVKESIIGLMLRSPEQIQKQVKFWFDSFLPWLCYGTIEVVSDIKNHNLICLMLEDSIISEKNSVEFPFETSSWHAWQCWKCRIAWQRLWKVFVIWMSDGDYGNMKLFEDVFWIQYSVQCNLFSWIMLIFSTMLSVNIACMVRSGQVSQKTLGIFCSYAFSSDWPIICDICLVAERYYKHNWKRGFSWQMVRPNARIGEQVYYRRLQHH